MQLIRLSRAGLALALLLALSFVTQAQPFASVVFEGLAPDHSLVKNPRHPFGDSEHFANWKIIRRPTGGLIGHIHTDGATSPLTAHLRIYEVREEDLLPPQRDSRATVWFAPSGLLAPGAPTRKLLYESSWTIENPSQPIPVVLPFKTGSKLNRCTLEIFGADEQLLYSCVPANVFTMSGDNFRTKNISAWIAATDEVALHRLKVKAKLPNTEAIEQLPMNWRNYREVRAVWVDRETELPAETIRRFILTGGWIFGRPENMPVVARKLDLPEGVRIFGGGLRGLDERGKAMANCPAALALRQLPGRSRFNSTLSTPLENNDNLFGRIKTRMQVFTFGLAGIYALAACIFLPLLYLRTKGEKRIGLWWKIPRATLAFSLLTVLIGWGFVLPKQPVSDITEYRFGYGDWPEVFCHTDAVALKYGRKEFGWKLPSQTAELLFKTEAETRRREGDDQPGMIAYHKNTMGNKTRSSFAYFLPLRQPFSAELENGQLSIVSDRDVRNCHIVYSHEKKTKWAKLGDLQAGQRMELPASPATFEINGIPDIATRAVKSLKRHEDLPIFGNDVFIVALDEHDTSAVSALNGKDRQDARVAWVAQVPVQEGGAQ